MSNYQAKEPLERFESFEQFFEQVEARPSYWVERAKLEVSNEVAKRMDQISVSKSELGKRLGVQPGMVTRFLSGHNNFELSTIVRIAFALNCRFRSHLQAVGTDTYWFDVLQNEPERNQIQPWNPEEFSGTTIFLPSMQQVNHESVSAAA
jgi:transcriptional regulator with XRE-family HTH domain